jgi:ABC-2 type transport system permease protein
MRRGVSQRRAFRRLRWRLTLNYLRSLWREHPLRLVTPAATTLALAGIVFGFSLVGFRELESHRETFAGTLVSGLFDVLFSALAGMLLLSTGVILYANLFTSPEARFLLATPATATGIFAAGFRSAAAFSSFGFLVLGFPILVAYGLVARVAPSYLALLPLFLAGFSLFPAALSSIICLLLMSLHPHHRRTLLLLSGLILLALIGFWLHRVGVSTRQAIAAANPEATRSLAGHFSLASHPWLPGRWMTDGLLAAAQGELAPSLQRLVLLWGVGLMTYQLAVALSARLYRHAFDKACGGSPRRRRVGGHVLDRLMEGLVAYLDKPTRLLVVKDFRTFRRDPTQWVLLVGFVLMLAMGIVNFRSFTTHSPASRDLALVGLANLAGTAVLICAGLSRFVFPLISLEGRRFWILGLLPMARRQILAGKFAFAATGSALTGLVIVLGSELLLGLPAASVAVHATTIATLAIGLSGLNVGLGACLANYRETDPSKIVVGPSGTVNMVLGMLYLTITLAIMAGPLHAASMLLHDNSTTHPTLPAWVFFGIPIGLALSTAAAWIPLRLGRHALEQSEF